MTDNYPNLVHDNDSDTRFISNRQQATSNLTNQGSPYALTILRCGRSVPTSLYVSLRDHVQKRAKVLQLGIPYKLKMICGNHYWSALRNLKTAAGWIMAELVDEGLVPYLFASERDSKPLWYRLKP